MRTRLLLAAVVLALPGTTPARADHIKDPAELMPAKTVVYVELRQPGQLVKEIANLFEGTALGNVPDSLTKLFDRGDRPRGSEPLGASGLLFAPEVIREVQRIRGAGVAFTGMGKMGPEGVAVILPGDSNGPPLLMRAFLATGPVRPAGEVEGVKLYQLVAGGGARFKLEETRPPRRPDDPQTSPPREKKPDPRDRERGDGKVAEQLGRRDDRPVAEAREEGAPEPVFAMTDEALLIGTADAVKDTVRRIKGKAKGETLSGVKTFKEVRNEVGDQPGLFIYADVAGAMALVQKHLPGGGDRELAALKAFLELMNMKAFRAAGYGLTLEKGTLRYRELVLLDPDEKSAVLELLPTAAVQKDLLQFTPADTVLAAALSNNNGKERWAKALKFADAVAKLGGAGDRLPSEEVGRMEKQLGIEFGKDVFGRVNGVAFALGNPMDAPVKRTMRKGKDFEVVSHDVQIPMVFVVQATDEDAAKSLADELLPKLCAQLSGNDAKPTTKVIEGQKIHTVPGVLKHHDEEALHYGRAGKTIVLGPVARPVAQALTNGARERGWGSNEKVAEQLGKLDDTIMVAVARPFTLIGGALFRPSHFEERRILPDKAPPPPPPPEKPTASPPKPAVVAVQEKADAQDKEEAKFKKEFAELMKDEGLLVFRITRKPDRILEEMTLTGLKPTVGRLTDYGLKQWLSAHPRVGKVKEGSGTAPDRPRRNDPPPPRPDQPLKDR
jgi:hypothetical protein